MVSKLTSLFGPEKETLSQNPGAAFFSGRIPSISIEIPKFVPSSFEISDKIASSNTLSSFYNKYIQKNLMPIIIVTILIFFLIIVYLVNVLNKREQKEKRKRHKKNAQLSSQKSDIWPPVQSSDNSSRKRVPDLVDETGDDVLQ